MQKYREKMSKISVILITKNEEKNIAACIESIKWADEIIVIDSNSSDNTVKICHELGAKVTIEPWSGFGPQKNKSLDRAQHDWILSIDADERVTPALRDEILTIISQENLTDNNNSYKIPRQNYFYQRSIKHALCAKHDAPIRLFRKSLARFSDDTIHEKIIATGTICKLKNCLHHFPFHNLEELIHKTNLYSTLGIKKLIDKKVQPSITKAFVHALWIFTKIYFIRLGFLDGWPGFLIAMSNFEGTFYRYAKLLEYYKYQN